MERNANVSGIRAVQLFRKEVGFTLLIGLMFVQQYHDVIKEVKLISAK